MLRDEEILYGKIAIKKGFITRKELKEVLRRQQEEENPPPIGEILLDAGMLTQDQHEIVLRLQEQNLENFDPLTKEKNKENLFGQLAVERGYLDEETLQEVIKKKDLLAKKGQRIRLGELLVREGLMTSDQVHELLEDQDKRLMSCQNCDRQYNVALPPRTEQRLSCPECGGDLRTVEEHEKKEESDLSATDTVGLPPAEEVFGDDQPAGTEDVDEPVELGDRREHKCVICDKQFLARTNAQNRVKCPNCETIFSPDRD